MPLNHELDIPNAVCPKLNSWYSSGNGNSPLAVVQAPQLRVSFISIWLYFQKAVRMQAPPPAPHLTGPQLLHFLLRLLQESPYCSSYFYSCPHFSPFFTPQPERSFKNFSLTISCLCWNSSNISPSHVKWKPSPFYLLQDSLLTSYMSLPLIHWLQPHQFPCYSWNTPDKGALRDPVPAVAPPPTWFTIPFPLDLDSSSPSL